MLDQRGKFSEERKRIYESGEKAKYPQQPWLDTKVEFTDLNRAAEKGEDVRTLRSFVRQPWIIKEEGLATVVN